tara:strand:+ start:319 stop:1572 length:1254 start_codon:yes stop_codon:yes gene_type:complete
MPMIQLIRRDGDIIELEATNVAFSVTRSVAVWAIPVFGVRAGFDTNANLFSVTVSGILTDDTNVSGSNGATAHIDLSRATNVSNSWFAQQDAIGNNTIAKVVTALHGKRITFSSAGQIDAGLGEDITLQFYSSGVVPAATVATNSIIPVNLTGAIPHTGSIATAIKTAFDAASVKVNTVTVANSTIFSTSLSAGSASTSASDQGLSSVTSEKLTFTNLVKSSNGNTRTLVSGDASVTTQEFASPFFVSNFTGGVTGSRKTKGDKVQDLINMTVNASAGGGMLSPQSFTGDLIEMPDSLANFDVSKLLRIDQSDSVSKYIVGMRIPYESLITATGVSEELRQFIIPSGPGTDYASHKNIEPFDPVDVIDGETVRPNPFFRQGIAIPGVVQTFNPAYAAGDSVWTYELGFNACEQLIGI